MFQMFVQLQQRPDLPCDQKAGAARTLSSRVSRDSSADMGTCKSTILLASIPVLLRRYDRFCIFGQHVGQVRPGVRGVLNDSKDAGRELQKR